MLVLIPYPPALQASRLRSKDTHKIAKDDSRAIFSREDPVGIRPGGSVMKSKCFVFLTILFLPALSHAQAWSGIINSTRAVDWSLVGTVPGRPGLLPDSSWTQCGPTINTPTTAAAITSAIGSCGANQYVQLGAGTFNLSDCIQFPTTGHQALRGMGANSTFLAFSGNASCSGDLIQAYSSDGTYRGQPRGTEVVYNWTSGFAQGATQIVLSSVTGIVPNQTVVLLTQCDTGFTGSDCTGGGPTDNNGYFECAQPWTSTGVGCNVAGESADGPSWRAGSDWTQEFKMVTAINQGGCGATCVTITPPLHHPNWSSGQNPQATVIQFLVQVGVENLSINGSAISGSGIGYQNCYECWVSGIRVVNVSTWSIQGFQVVNSLFQNSYFFGNPTNYGDNTGVHIQGGNNLVQNNICQQVHLCYLADGPDEGTVVAYNFSINQQTPSSNMWFSAGPHGGPSNDFRLYEGNAWTRIVDDDDHGGHLNMTTFRNFIWGWESCANGQCGGATAKDSATDVIDHEYGTRYAADIANVLGTPGFHNTYFDNGRFGAQVVYEFGGAYGSQPFDALTQSTSLFWGNYDVVTGNVRWCGNSSDTGWVAVCGSTSEVPTGAPTYPNSVPTLGDTGAGQGALPASFYLPSKPSWFGSSSWPPIGPDVSSGNVGQCSGALNVAGQFDGLAALSNAQCGSHGFTAGAWGGHVNAIPAMSCYLNIMGGVPDGTGSALSFNASACYGSGSSFVAPPTIVSVVVK